MRCLLILSMIILFVSGCANTNLPAVDRSAEARQGIMSIEANVVSFQPDSPALQQIRIETAMPRTIDLVIEANGQLQANANAVTRISAPIEGKVTEVTACLGDQVKAGQVLAVINSQEIGALITDLFKTETEIKSDLSKDLLEIDCDLKQTQAQEGFAQKQYDREKLLLDEKIASQAAVEAVQTDLEKQKLTLCALEEKKERTKQVSAEKMQMAKTAVQQKLSVLGMPKQTVNRILNGRDVVSAIPIVAPQSGFVLERDINHGELVDPSRVLFVVDDIDSLWLMADIFEQDVEHVSQGQEIEFTVDSFPRETFKGRLDFVAGTLDPETRTLRVRAVIANPQFKLKPKMFARMKILAGKHLVLTVPKSAVQDAGSEKVVYVPISKSSFAERQVKLGDETADYVEIVDGLKGGESVVTNGSFSLRAQSLKQSK